MKKHALLLRMNPQHWPIWDSKITKDSDTDVWFITGRRRASDIIPDIPVVVLGTENLGVVAWGKTSSHVEFRPDPDWQESPPKHQAEGKEPKNRVRVAIKRVDVPLNDVQGKPSISNLHRTRETTTWLTDEQYQELCDLIGEI